MAEMIDLSLLWKYKVEIMVLFVGTTLIRRHHDGHVRLAHAQNKQNGECWRALVGRPDLCRHQGRPVYRHAFDDPALFRTP